MYIYICLPSVQRERGYINFIHHIVPIQSSGPVTERAVVKYEGTCAGWEDELSECQNGELQIATCYGREPYYVGAICQRGKAVVQHTTTKLNGAYYVLSHIQAQLVPIMTYDWLAQISRPSGD